MKKIHILGIVVIAVAIGVIIYSLGSSATYSDFTEAAANPDTEYHVVGKLNKTVPVQYDPNLSFISDLNRPLLTPLRRILPNMGGLDLSPIAALFLLKMSEILLVGWLSELGKQLV